VIGNELMPFLTIYPSSAKEENMKINAKNMISINRSKPKMPTNVAGILIIQGWDEHSNL
jgi:hypothetical protein